MELPKKRKVDASILTYARKKLRSADSVCSVDVSAAAGSVPSLPAGDGVGI